MPGWIGSGVSTPLPPTAVVDGFVGVVFEGTSVVEDGGAMVNLVVVVLIGTGASFSSMQYEKPSLKFPHSAVMEGFYGLPSALIIMG
jgi:hypothetical protein